MAIGGGEPPAEFLRKARESGGIETLPIDENSVLQLPKLPRLHADPFDRILICQAIEHGLTVVTPDEAITQYPVRTMWG